MLIPNEQACLDLIRVVCYDRLTYRLDVRLSPPRFHCTDGRPSNPRYGIGRLHTVMSRIPMLIACGMLVGMSMSVSFPNRRIDPIQGSEPWCRWLLCGLTVPVLDALLKIRVGYALRQESGVYVYMLY
jgi:hypothetical protein